MEELLKKIAEAFAVYLAPRIEQIVEGKMVSLTAVDEDRVNELISDQIAAIKEERQDRFDEKVRRVVSDMSFTTEAREY